MLNTMVELTNLFDETINISPYPKMVTMKSLLQQLSLFAVVLGISSLYCFCSITSIALGASSSSPTSSSSTTASNTTDTTLNEVSVLNGKGVSLNGVGKFKESITYFDKVLAL